MQTNPFLVPCPSDSRPAPQAVTWASEHHWKTGEPWTGKWVWKQLWVPPKAASAPTPVSTDLSAAQNYQKSPLMSISKISAIFCFHYISPSLYFQTFWVTQWQRMSFWLSLMFSLSATAEKLSQAVPCPCLCHFSGKLFLPFEAALLYFSDHQGQEALGHYFSRK